MLSRPLPLSLLVTASLTLFACDCGANGDPGVQACERSSDCTSPQVCIDDICVDPPDGSDGGTDAADNNCFTDEDHDGYGLGCDNGPDCDDTDPTQTGVEVCDGADNDCDGVADNGVLSPCGDCDMSCDLSGFGPGSDMPFDPSMDDADGVGLDDSGALVLDSRAINTQYIWIANTGEGTVSKVDTETYTEVARYVTGPDGAGNDPSRTSVNSAGDVFVANRGGMSITRISTLGTDCVDRTGDGLVTTSTSTTALPWGQDDCMMWSRDLEGQGVLRSVAAQDIVTPDGDLIEYVWVGGWSGWVWKLDGQTGDILISTEAPVTPYGFALDGSGNLWMAGLSSRIGRLDTNRCVDDASCADAVCDGEGEPHDSCVKQAIPSVTTYGVTVDFQQRVWFGGWSGAVVQRYDPTAAAGSRWTAATSVGNCNGVAADGAGFIYVACQSSSTLLRIDANDPTQWRSFTDSNMSPRGVAIDAAGKVWGINRAHSTATVLTPGPTIDDNDLNVTAATGFVSPYTYSDMTGIQLRLATNPRGYWRTVIEACPDRSPSDEVTWQDLRFEAETPAGTSVLFRVKVAATREGLDTEDWTTIATVPSDTSPLDLGALLMDAGLEPHPYLMLEVQLISDRTSMTEVITPRVLGVDATFICEEQVG